MDNKDSNIVYHYCDVAKALSILRNNELWMTSVRNLNDAKEVTRVYDMFLENLQVYDNKNQKRLDKMFKFAFTPGAVHMYENTLGALPYYVVCFSKDSDSVSQWGMYADSGQGIAIGFDKNIFKEITVNKCFEFKSIKYVDETDINSHIVPIYDYLLSNFNENALTMMDIVMNKIKELYSSGIDVKSFHYAGEKEVRLIYKTQAKSNVISEKWYVGDINLYAKRNCINTYVPLKFPKQAIKSIVIGPKYQKNFFELEMAMDKMGYKVSNIEIKKSTSAYR